MNNIRKNRVERGRETSKEYNSLSLSLSLYAVKHKQLKKSTHAYPTNDGGWSGGGGGGGIT